MYEALRRMPPDRLVDMLIVGERRNIGAAASPDSVFSRMDVAPRLAVMVVRSSFHCPEIAETEESLDGWGHSGMVACRVLVNRSSARVKRSLPEARYSMMVDELNSRWR